MAGKKRRFGRVRKLPSGRWQARYRGPDGIDHPAPHTFGTKKEAERWLAKKEDEIEDGRWLDPADGKTTVGEWAEQWLSSVGPQLKLKTRASYRSLINSRITPCFGQMGVADVRPIMVAQWVADMTGQGLSASRIRQAYRVLSQIMTAAVVNRLIPETPCRGVRLPRMPHTEPHIVTPLEASRVARAADSPHDLLISLLAFAGLRIGEAFALRRSDVDLQHGWLRVDENLAEAGGVMAFDTPKSHQTRVLTLSATLVGRLRAHLATGVPDRPDALLFTNSKGKPLRYNEWRKAHFDPAVKAAGLTDVTPHDLRASHATWVADRHGVMTAARRLGHSNASVTTRHYARAMDGRDAEVAQGLDEWLKPSGHDNQDRARSGHDDDDDGSAGVPALV
ncbi:site-specific integrase [Streptomyces capparidis]